MENDKNKDHSTEYERLKHSYQSTVGFHNTLLQTRFAVAALFMTASAFLVQTYLDCSDKCPSEDSKVVMLGAIVTIACWMLELRNESLLKNLQMLGSNIEKKLGISKEIGFFYLMGSPQQYGIRIPFLCEKTGNDCRLSNKCFLVRYFLVVSGILCV